MSARRRAAFALATYRGPCPRGALRDRSPAAFGGARSARVLAHRFAFALALALGVLVRPSLASPGIDFGFGSRAQALGGAGVAIADDSMAVFNNPSVLVRAEHVAVTAGYSNV